MSVSVGAPLKPDSFQLTNWTSWTVTDSAFPNANFSAYNWKGRPLRNSDLPTLPIFWCKESAKLAIDASRHDGTPAALVPDVPFGMTGSIIRAPKAIIYPVYGFIRPQHNTAISMAIANVATLLNDKHIFAGPAADVGAERGSMVPCGLPWTTVRQIDEDLPHSSGGTIDVYAKEFTDDSCSGGEILYLNVADSNGANWPPYFYYNVTEWEDFDLLKAADRTWLEKNFPRHKKVRWLCVMGLFESVIAGGVSDKDKCQQRIEQLNSEWGSLGFKGVFVDGWLVTSPAAIAAAAAAIEAEIREFFGL